MSLTIYSVDNYLKVGIQKLWNKHWGCNSETNIVIIDIGAFPDELLSPDIFTGERRVVLLFPAGSCAVLLAFIENRFRSPVCILDRNASLKEISDALTHKEKDVFLYHRKPSLTESEGRVLFLFINDRLSAERGRRLPAIPSMKPKTVSYYRRKLMVRLGFHSPQLFYLHILTLARFVKIISNYSI